LPEGKGGWCVRLTTLPPSCAIVMKSGNLNFLEPSGPLQACNGTALPYHFGQKPVHDTIFNTKMTYDVLTLTVVPIWQSNFEVHNKYRFQLDVLVYFLQACGVKYWKTSNTNFVRTDITSFNVDAVVGDRHTSKGKIFFAVCFILGDSPAAEFYMPTFRNTLFHIHRRVGYLPMKMEQSVPKRRHIKFRRREITQKKAYNIQNRAKVSNHETASFFNK